MYEFWYDYVKLKHGEKAKLCYMDRLYTELGYMDTMIFVRTLQKILKLDLILQITN